MRRGPIICITPPRIRSVVLAAVFVLAALSAQAEQVDIAGPAGSVAFGTVVKVLPNGNFVVTDPDGGPFPHSGAVYLYSPDGTLISTLTGDSPGDRIGISGIVVVGDSNFVVVSPSWSNDSVPGVSVRGVGAVTWVDGELGLNGVVSPENSLVGTSEDDHVGIGGATALINGNYVVASSSWDNGTAADAGAATWGSGSLGIVGPVTTENSLVGTGYASRIGSGRFNSNGIVALANGNYVVVSPWWSDGSHAYAGAVTWGNGTQGTTGPASSSNSLVGSHDDERLGSGGVAALSNGNYVVPSPRWDNGTVSDAGAATWGDGTHGASGQANTSNSMFGTNAGDKVGLGGVTALSDGNYVVQSPVWSDIGIGAVTWGEGTKGQVGPVTSDNSLIGTNLPNPVTALADGNYVVASPYWANSSSSYAGAATWVEGGAPYAGVVTAVNSLVGTQENDNVGSSGVIALSDGNYVVASPRWNKDASMDVGGVTWGDGVAGTIGTLSSVNSLIGTTEDSGVGTHVTALDGGKYVVASVGWDSETATNVGAVTWCRAGGVAVGQVTAYNSLTGSNDGDRIGIDRRFNLSDGIRAFGDGNYVVSSPDWDNSGMVDAGAITLASGKFRLTGTITPWNSVIGGVANGGNLMTYDYDPNLHRLIVGRPLENFVSLFSMDQIFADGVEP